jgi:hypothetical protein
MCIIEQAEAACLSLVNPGSFRIRASALTLKPPIESFLELQFYEFDNFERARKAL